MGQTAPQSPSGVQGIDNGNPWGKLLQGGLKGLGNGLQTYGNEQAVMQNRGGAMPQAGGGVAQPVDPAYFQPQGQDRLIKRAGGMSGNNLAFYGGGQ